MFPKKLMLSKTSKSKECDICHYWYFLNKRFKFEPMYAIDVIIS